MQLISSGGDKFSLSALCHVVKDSCEKILLSKIILTLKLISLQKLDSNFVTENFNFNLAAPFFGCNLRSLDSSSAILPACGCSHSIAK